MFDRLIGSFRSFAKAVVDFTKNILNTITGLLLSVSKKYGRVRHLAFYSRKARVRKKNAGRLLDALFYEVKKHEYSNSMV